MKAFRGEQRLMGIVHPSSEGVPGGLSAGGQRRRMAGCGAPGSSVSRLSPSIPRTFPVKRPRRYSAAFLLPLFLCSVHISCLPLLWSTQPHLHARHTNIHSLTHKLVLLWIRDLMHWFFLLRIDPSRNSKPAYYSRPGWLCSQPEDGEPFFCAFYVELFFYFYSSAFSCSDSLLYFHQKHSIHILSPS